MTTEKKLAKADAQTLKEFKFLESLMNTRNEQEIIDRLNHLFNDYDWFDVTFEEDGKVGVKDIAGRVVVPAIFEGCDAVQSILFRQPSMPMILDGKKVLVKTDGSGEVLSDAYSNMEGLPWSQLLLVKESPGGKTGLINRRGEIITPIELDTVHEPFNGYVAVQANGKFGVVCNEYVYFSPAFDEIELPAVGENLKVKKDGTWGYLTEDGHFTLDEEENAWWVDID